MTLQRCRSQKRIHILLCLRMNKGFGPAIGEALPFKTKASSTICNSPTKWYKNVKRSVEWKCASLTGRMPLSAKKSWDPARMRRTSCQRPSGWRPTDLDRSHIPTCLICGRFTPMDGECRLVGPEACWINHGNCILHGTLLRFVHCKGYPNASAKCHLRAEGVQGARWWRENAISSQRMRYEYNG